MPPLRIGFDLDGVLADMNREITRQAELFFATSASPPDDEDGPDDADVPAPAAARLALTPRQQKALWKHLRAIENFWERLDEIDNGTVKQIADLTREHGWEVIFLTSRPRAKGDTTQVQTQRWLQSKGFRTPSAFVVKGSRGLIASALDLDVVVDDRMENCMDVVADSKARAILVWRDEGQQIPTAAKRLGIGVAASMTECLSLLVQLEEDGGERPRPLDRVKRLLGFKEPA